MPAAAQPTVLPGGTPASASAPAALAAAAAALSEPQLLRLAANLRLLLGHSCFDDWTGAMALAREEADSVKGSAFHIGRIEFDDAWQITGVVWLRTYRVDKIAVGRKGAQTGQAPMPCERTTFSATRICSSREAPAGEPLPPLACQVPMVNCRPP